MHPTQSMQEEIELAGPITENPQISPNSLGHQATE
jgi:hypothetical protein